MSKQSNVTYVTIQDGKELKSIRESVFTGTNEERVKAGQEPIEAIRQQTFLLHEAEGLADISTLTPNEAVAVAFYNRGSSLAQLNEIRTLMEDDQFTPVDGVYDLIDVLNTVRERRKMSPEDKALKILSELDPAVREAVMARFASAQASA
jgi:hypothetical protein